MSVNNGIYILATTETAERIDEKTGLRNESDHILIYRPAHVQAIDNFGYYEHVNPPMLGIYMKETWGKSRRCRTMDSALEHAQIMMDELGHEIEYGIAIIERFHWNTDYFYTYDIQNNLF